MAAVKRSMSGVRGLMAILAAMALLAGCTRREANPHQEIWEQANIDSYDLSVEITTFGTGTKYHVSVRDGDASDPVIDPDFFSGGLRAFDGDLPLSVEDLYGVIDDASDEDSVDVTYDAQGVPQGILVDPNREFSDDETSYTVKFTEVTNA